VSKVFSVALRLVVLVGSIGPWYSSPTIAQTPPPKDQKVTPEEAKKRKDWPSDLPKDFAQRRSSCYERLELPLSADAFITDLRREMTEALDRLEQGFPSNPHVRLDPRRKK